MKFLLTLLLIGSCALCYAQRPGSKVIFDAADGKTYTGIITEIEGERYKIKYEGFEFESWMLKTQFTVTKEMPDVPAPNQAPSPAAPSQMETGTAQSRTPVPVGVSEPAPQIPVSTTSSMTRTDSLKMAVTDMKKTIEAASKLFAVKTDTISIHIPNIDYENASLVRLKEALGNMKGMRSVNMHYSNAIARLEVSFKGNPAKLWDSVPADIRILFKLIEAHDSSITITQK